jgi:hypothetical protein
LLLLVLVTVAYVRVALFHEPLVVLVLPGIPRADVGKDRELVAPVVSARDPLGVVHPDNERLAALLADVDDPHDCTGGSGISARNSLTLRPLT